MTTILRIDVSARTERSLTRDLSQRFIDEWLKQRPTDKIVQRDIGLNPPPAVSEDWIAAAFTPAKGRTKAQQATLHLSDTLIDEVNEQISSCLGHPGITTGCRPRWQYRRRAGRAPCQMLPWPSPET